MHEISNSDENSRLLRAYQRMRKVQGHGEDTLSRHPSIRPEWVMRVIEEPYDRYEEHQRGESRTCVVGRVSESSHWIKLVFVGDPETGEFLTAYQDRRLAERYGGRPWQTK